MGKYEEYTGSIRFFSAKEFAEVVNLDVSTITSMTNNKYLSPEYVDNIPFYSSETLNTFDKRYENYLKILPTKNDLSIPDLARSTGVSESTLYLMEQEGFITPNKIFNEVSFYNKDISTSLEELVEQFDKYMEEHYSEDGYELAERELTKDDSLTTEENEEDEKVEDEIVDDDDEFDDIVEDDHESYREKYGKAMGRFTHQGNSSSLQHIMADEAAAKAENDRLERLKTEEDARYDAQKQEEAKRAAEQQLAEANKRTNSSDNYSYNASSIYANDYENKLRELDKYEAEKTRIENENKARIKEAEELARQKREADANYEKMGTKGLDYSGHEEHLAYQEKTTESSSENQYKSETPQYKSSEYSENKYDTKTSEYQSPKSDNNIEQTNVSEQYTSPTDIHQTSKDNYSTYDLPKSDNYTTYNEPNYKQDTSQSEPIKTEQYTPPTDNYQAPKDTYNVYTSSYEDKKDDVTHTSSETDVHKPHNDTATNQESIQFENKDDAISYASSNTVKTEYKDNSSSKFESETSKQSESYKTPETDSYKPYSENTKQDIYQPEKKDEYTPYTSPKTSEPKYEENYSSKYENETINQSDTYKTPETDNHKPYNENTKQETTQSERSEEYTPYIPYGAPEEEIKNAPSHQYGKEVTQQPDTYKAPETPETDTYKPYSEPIQKQETYQSERKEEHIPYTSSDVFESEYKDSYSPKLETEPLKQSDTYNIPEIDNYKPYSENAKQEAPQFEKREEYKEYIPYNAPDEEHKKDYTPKYEEKPSQRNDAYKSSEENNYKPYNESIKPEISQPTIKEEYKPYTPYNTPEEEHKDSYSSKFENETLKQNDSYKIYSNSPAAQEATQYKTKEEPVSHTPYNTFETEKENIYKPHSASPDKQTTTESPQRGEYTSFVPYGAPEEEKNNIYSPQHNKESSQSEKENISKSAEIYHPETKSTPHIKGVETQYTDRRTTLEEHQQSSYDSKTEPSFVKPSEHTDTIPERSNIGRSADTQYSETKSIPYTSETETRYAVRKTSSKEYQQNSYEDRTEPSFVKPSERTDTTPERSNIGRSADTQYSETKSIPYTSETEIRYSDRKASFEEHQQSSYEDRIEPSFVKPSEHTDITTEKSNIGRPADIQPESKSTFYTREDETRYPDRKTSVETSPRSSYEDRAEPSFIRPSERTDTTPERSNIGRSADTQYSETKSIPYTSETETRYADRKTSSEEPQHNSYEDRTEPSFIRLSERTDTTTEKSNIGRPTNTQPESKSTSYTREIETRYSDRKIATETSSESSYDDKTAPSFIRPSERNAYHENLDSMPERRIPHTTDSSPKAFVSLSDTSLQHTIQNNQNPNTETTNASGYTIATAQTEPSTPLSPKYSLSDETQVVNGVTLYRVVAERDFGTIKKGMKGGWVESEHNLSQTGNSWIANEAIVMGNSRVQDNATVKDHATLITNVLLSDSARVLGNAEIAGNVIIRNRAMVLEDVRINNDVEDKTRIIIEGHSRIREHAIISDSVHISDFAEIRGNSLVAKNAEISGHAKLLGDVSVSDTALITGNAVLNGQINITGRTSIEGYVSITQENSDTALTIYNREIKHDRPVSIVNKTTLLSNSTEIITEKKARPRSHPIYDKAVFSPALLSRTPQGTRLLGNGSEINRDESSLTTEIIQPKFRVLNAVSLSEVGYNSDSSSSGLLIPTLNDLTENSDLFVPEFSDDDIFLTQLDTDESSVFYADDVFYVDDDIPFIEAEPGEDIEVIVPDPEDIFITSIEDNTPITDTDFEDNAMFYEDIPEISYPALPEGQSALALPQGAVLLALPDGNMAIQLADSTSLALPESKKSPSRFDYSNVIPVTHYTLIKTNGRAQVVFDAKAIREKASRKIRRVIKGNKYGDALARTAWGATTRKNISRDSDYYEHSDNFKKGPSSSFGWGSNPKFNKADFSKFSKTILTVKTLTKLIDGQTAKRAGRFLLNKSHLRESETFRGYQKIKTIVGIPVALTVIGGLYLYKQHAINAAKGKLIGDGSDFKSVYNLLAKKGVFKERSVNFNNNESVSKFIKSLNAFGNTNGLGNLGAMSVDQLQNLLKNNPNLTSDQIAAIQAALKFKNISNFDTQGFLGNLQSLGVNTKGLKIDFSNTKSLQNVIAQIDKRIAVVGKNSDIGKSLLKQKKALTKVTKVDKKIISQKHTIKAVTMSILQSTIGDSDFYQGFNTVYRPIQTVSQSIKTARSTYNAIKSLVSKYAKRTPYKAGAKKATSAVGKTVTRKVASVQNKILARATKNKLRNTIASKLSAKLGRSGFYKMGMSAFNAAKAAILGKTAVGASTAIGTSTAVGAGTASTVAAGTAAGATAAGATAGGAAAGGAAAATGATVGTGGWALIIVAAIVAIIFIISIVIMAVLIIIAIFVLSFGDFDEDADPSKVMQSLAGKSIEIVYEMDEDWMNDLKDASLGSTNAQHKTGYTNPETNAPFTIKNYGTPIKGITGEREVVPIVNYQNGNKESIGMTSNAKAILSAANVYFQGRCEKKSEFKNFCKQLWTDTHEILIDYSLLHPCDLGDEEVKYYCNQTYSNVAVIDGDLSTSAKEANLKYNPDGCKTPHTISYNSGNYVSRICKDSSGNALYHKVDLGLTSYYTKCNGHKFYTGTPRADCTAILKNDYSTFATYEKTNNGFLGIGATYEFYDSQTITYSVYVCDCAACAGHKALVCTGHIDATVTGVIYGVEKFNETTKESYVDNIETFIPRDTQGDDYTTEKLNEYGFNGWNESNIKWFESLFSTDWYEMYGISFAGGMGVPLSRAEIEEYISEYCTEDAAAVKWPYIGIVLQAQKDLRTEIIRFALDSVGRVPYYFGGKTSINGYEGNNFGGLAAVPDYTGRINKGLDCTGWMCWVYCSATNNNKYRDVNNNLPFTSLGRKLSSIESPVPGDICDRVDPSGKGDPTKGHVGIYLGETENGKIVTIEETAGDSNNVTVMTRSKSFWNNGFWRIAPIEKK